MTSLLTINSGKAVQNVKLKGKPKKLIKFNRIRCFERTDSQTIKFILKESVSLVMPKQEYADSVKV